MHIWFFLLVPSTNFHKVNHPVQLFLFEFDKKFENLNWTKKKKKIRIKLNKQHKNANYYSFHQQRISSMIWLTLIAPIILSFPNGKCYKAEFTNCMNHDTYWYTTDCKPIPFVFVPIAVICTLMKKIIASSKMSYLETCIANNHRINNCDFLYSLFLIMYQVDDLKDLYSLYV